MMSKLFHVVTNFDCITAGPVQSVIVKLPPLQEVGIRILETKSVSTTSKDGLGTCLSYNREDGIMAVAIFSTMIMIWKGEVILIRLM